MRLPLNIFIAVLIGAILVIIILQRNHLLIALLFLEMIILLLTLYTCTIFASANRFFLLIILTFGACEARIGLALLIAITRRYGSGIISLLIINKC